MTTRCHITNPYSEHRGLCSEVHWEVTHRVWFQHQLEAAYELGKRSGEAQGFDAGLEALSEVIAPKDKAAEKMLERFFDPTDNFMAHMRDLFDQSRYGPTD